MPSIGGVWPRATSSTPPASSAAAVRTRATQRISMVTSLPPGLVAPAARPAPRGPAWRPRAIPASAAPRASACARRGSGRDVARDPPRAAARGRAASGRRGARTGGRRRARASRARLPRRGARPPGASTLPQGYAVELADHVQLLEQVEALDHAVVLEQPEPRADDRLVERGQGQVRPPLDRLEREQQQRRGETHRERDGRRPRPPAA